SRKYGPERDPYFISTHAGIPWLRFLRKNLGDRVHFWPFDGWKVPPGKSAVVEVYPAEPLRRMGDRGVLRVVNNTYLNETYLPKAIAFYHCGNSAAMAFARRSTEIVLRVLPILFDRELESPQGSDQRQFTFDEVEKEARVIDSSAEPNTIFTGLF